MTPQARAETESVHGVSGGGEGVTCYLYFVGFADGDN